MKKQAILVRIPGLQAYPPSKIEHLGDVLQIALAGQFPDKEVVVLIYHEDIQFMKEGDIRDLIDKLENVIN